MTQIHGVICYWKLKDGIWILKESYPIDDDGYSLTKTSTEKEGRHEYLAWTNKRKRDDLVPIMGRAVTSWDLETGVRLLDFHPPEWTGWLSPQFYEELKKLPNWYVFIDGGDKMFEDTCIEVRKIVFG